MARSKVIVYARLSPRYVLLILRNLIIPAADFK
jgi:hypothetical protein